MDERVNGERVLGLRWVMLETAWEGYGQLATGRDAAEQDVADGVAELAAHEPALYDRRGLIDPRHFNGAAGDVDNGGSRVGFQHGVDELVLVAREPCHCQFELNG
jgi:hypothetical protein